VSVATKSLNRYIWSYLADRTENSTKCTTGHRGPNWIVTNDHKQVDWLCIVNGCLEPRLFDHVGSFDDFGYVAIPCKIEQHPESHNTETLSNVSKSKVHGIPIYTLLSLEVAILRPNILELFRSWIDDLYVTCQILVTVHL
jgi:hypothetical protein